MKTLSLLFLIYLSVAALAEDIITTDKKTYTGVTITKVEPDGLRIIHDTGTAKIPFDKLPAEIQKKHGYDPDKAATFKKSADAKAAQEEAALDKELGEATAAIATEKNTAQLAAEKFRKANLIYSKVYRVGSENVIVECYIPAGIYGDPNPQKREIITSGTIWISGFPEIGKLADDDHLECLVYPTGKSKKLGASTYREFEYIGPKP